jgi:cell division control protein 11
VDSRIHCILYFLLPNGHGLREVDVLFIRKLGTRANIIPVVAKADSMTPKELRQFKQKVVEDLNHYQLPFFNFPVYEEEDDEDVIAENQELRGLVPFAVMGSDEMVMVDGVRTRCRQYPWGTVYSMFLFF